MKTSVLIFPGSNCDQDAIKGLSKIEGNQVTAVWHADNALPQGTDLVIIPGGFSYGDYLRCGAMSATANIMKALRDHASRGGLAVGICNGFQILTESGLLPGALLQNEGLKFLCHPVNLRVERNDLPFTNLYQKGQVVTYPIAHNEGRFYISQKELTELEDNGQVLFRYCSPTGEITPQYNPNGTLNNIAGIVNKTGNVLGLMPHPERFSDNTLGGNDGEKMWLSILNYLTKA